jgi:glycosyltransferase involved in cell wall biosynthesis
LVRHLPDAGIKPVIITGQTPDMASKNHERIIAKTEDLDGASLPVIRVKGLDPIAYYQRHFQQPGGYGNSQSAAPPVEPGRTKKLKRVIRSFWIPDEKRGWIKSWIEGGLSAAGEAFDLVYSSSAPYSCHLAGAQLAKRLNCPWVMELRDLWAANPYSPHTHNWISRLIQNKMEAQCVSQAARLVVTSRAHARFLIERYSLDQDRVAVIPTGFDAEAISAESRAANGEAADKEIRNGDGILRIFYAGNFYGGRHLNGLGKALDNVSGELSGFKHAVLEVAGRSFDLPWERILGGSGPNRILHGTLPHSEIQSLLHRVHAGVLHNPSHDTIHIPGKLYEYIGAGLPVLDLTAQPEIPALCKDAVPCWKCDPDDGQQIAQALIEISAWWKENGFINKTPGREHELASRAISGNLADLLFDVAGETAKC